MRISDLSKMTGVSQRMLRHYEELGLLSPARSDGDYRTYSLEHQSRVIEIRELQRLGLALKEIGDLFAHPENLETIFRNVYSREKSGFIERQKSLQDLRARLLEKTNSVNEARVAYTIPGMDTVVSQMSGNDCLMSEYMRMSDWNACNSKTLLIGEIIWQSSFYLLSANEPDKFPTLEKLMREFCKSAVKTWKHFDGHPPHPLSPEDIHEFIAPNEIVISLSFKDQLQVVLPYSSIFALAKASEIGA